MGSRSFKLAIALLSLAMPISAIAQTTNTPSGNPVGTPQVEQPQNGNVNWKGAGIGAATLLANVGYIPAKTVYAILGGITGGAGYALTGGNQQTANAIWRSSLGGDYVLTPDMIRGDAPIHFSGPSVPWSGTTAPATQPLGSKPPPPVAASSAPVYPNTSVSSSPSTGLGAPPLAASTGPSSTPSHFTTRITGPGDSGTGPLHENDIE